MPKIPLLTALLFAVMASAHCTANNTSTLAAPIFKKDGTEVLYTSCTTLPPKTDAKLVISKSDFNHIKKLCTSQHALHKLQTSNIPSLAKLRKLLAGQKPTSILLEVAKEPKENVVISICPLLTKSHEATLPQKTISILGLSATISPLLKTLTESFCAEKPRTNKNFLGNFLGGAATIALLATYFNTQKASNTPLHEPQIHHERRSSTTEIQAPTQTPPEEILSGVKLRREFIKMLRKYPISTTTSRPPESCTYLSCNAKTTPPKKTRVVYVILASELEGNALMREALIANILKSKIDDKDFPFLWVSCLVLNDTTTKLTTGNCSRNDKNRKYLGYFKDLRGFGRTKIEIAQPLTLGNITRSKLTVLLDAASKEKKIAVINSILGISPNPLQATHLS
jgi:hypothetical protein